MHKKVIKAIISTTVFFLLNNSGKGDFQISNIGINKEALYEHVQTVSISFIFFKCEKNKDFTRLVFAKERQRINLSCI